MSNSLKDIIIIKFHEPKNVVSNKYEEKIDGIRKKN